MISQVLLDRQACGGASSLRYPDALGISFHMSLRRELRASDIG